MKIGPTILLVILALGLGGFLLAERVLEIPTTDQRLAQMKRVYPGFKRGDVDRIEVVRTDGGIVAVRVAGSDDWTLETPVQARADRAPIDQILSKLEFLEARDVVIGAGVEPARLEDLGLGDAATTLRFRWKGREQVLRLGRDTPLEGERRLYARAGDSPDLIVVDNAIRESVGKEAQAFRDKRYIDLDRWRVTGAELRYEGRRLVLEKGEGEQWRLLEPVPCRLDRWKVEDLLDKLKGMKVETFVDEVPADPAPYGLDRPFLFASLREGSGDEAKTRVLEIGRKVDEKKDWIHIRTGEAPTLYAVAVSNLADIDKDVADLRDRHVERIDAWDAARILVAEPTGRVEIEKVSGAWQVRPRAAEGEEEVPGRKAEDKAVRDLLDGIDGLEWTAVATEKAEDLAPYGLGEGALSVRVTEVKGEKEVVKAVLFGRSADEGGAAYAKVEAEDPVYEVAGDAIEPLVGRAWYEYLGRKILDLGPDALDRVTVAMAEPGADPVSWALEKDEKGTWTLASGRGEVQAAEVGAFLSRLLGLNCERWAAASPGKEHGVEGAVPVEVTIRNKGGTARSLRIGARAGEREYFASLDGEGPVFILAESAVQDLREGAGRCVTAPPAAGPPGPGPGTVPGEPDEDSPGED